jgi:hypothetical protein
MIAELIGIGLAAYFALTAFAVVAFITWPLDASTPSDVDPDDEDEP